MIINKIHNINILSFYAFLAHRTGTYVYRLRKMKRTRIYIERTVPLGHQTKHITYMNDNSSPEPDYDWLRYWSYVQSRLKSAESIANKKNLKNFISASRNEIRKTMKADFRLTTFKFDIRFRLESYIHVDKYRCQCNSDCYMYLPAPYNDKLRMDASCITFKDGVYYSPSGMEIVYWTLPWFGYQMSVNNNTNHTSENINSIVENAMILLELNDVHLPNYITTDIYRYDWLGYDSEGLVLYTKCLMTACCFFYEKHRKTSKDAISIDYLLFLCVHNLYERLTSNSDRKTCISSILKELHERNVKNFRSKYKQNDDRPVTVTLGECSKMERHSISMTKYDKSIDKKIEELYKDYSVREITNILNEEGIMISKSTVSRRISQNKELWESKERMSELLKNIL